MSNTGKGRDIMMIIPPHYLGVQAARLGHKLGIT